MSRFAKGDRVAETRYGAGNVVAVDERYTTINFDDGLVRKFVTRLARLTATSEPRPITPSATQRRPKRLREEMASRHVERA